MENSSNKITVPSITIVINCYIPVPIEIEIPKTEDLTYWINHFLDLSFKEKSNSDCQNAYDLCRTILRVARTFHAYLATAFTTSTHDCLSFEFTFDCFDDLNKFHKVLPLIALVYECEF